MSYHDTNIEYMLQISEHAHNRTLPSWLHEVLDARLLPGTVSETDKP